MRYLLNQKLKSLIIAYMFVIALGVLINGVESLVLILFTPLVYLIHKDMERRNGKFYRENPVYRVEGKIRDQYIKSVWSMQKGKYHMCNVHLLCNIITVETLTNKVDIIVSPVTQTYNARKNYIYNDYNYLLGKDIVIEVRNGPEEYLCEVQNFEKHF